MKLNRALSLLLAAVLCLALAVPALAAKAAPPFMNWDEEPVAAAADSYPETVVYTRTGYGAGTTTATIAWDAAKSTLSVYDQPYFPGAERWLFAMLRTETVPAGSPLAARLAYDGLKDNAPLIYAGCPLITSGRMRTLIVVENKGYQQTADQYKYTFSVNAKHQLTDVTCSKLEATGIYGTGIQRSTSSIHYTYDAAGRLTAIDCSDGNSSRYTYDAAGRLTTFTVNHVTFPADYASPYLANKPSYGADGVLSSWTAEHSGVFTESYKIG